MTERGAPEWDKSYPDPSRLRQEVDTCAEAYLEAIIGTVPKENILGLYLKGSTVKAWDSPLDYVPELSDLDVHILFSDEEAMTRNMGRMKKCMEIARLGEHLYHTRVPHPFHIPRIQLVVANQLFGQPDFISSPAETVLTRYGKPYPASQGFEAKRRPTAIKNLLAQQECMSKLPGRVMDRMGKYHRYILRDMSWRVSPAVPRVLDLLGAHFEEAWASNRTHLVGHLRTRGQPELALDYANFYLHAWRFLLSNDQDSEAARSAILSGARVLERSIEMATEMEAEATSQVP